MKNKQSKRKYRSIERGNKKTRNIEKIQKQREDGQAGRTQRRRQNIEAQRERK